MNSISQMNPNSMHKIVVAIGLAAVVASAGIYAFAARGEHDTRVTRNAPAAPLDQNAAEFTAPSLIAAAQTPTDQPATPSGALLAVPPVVSPTPVAPATTNVTEDTRGTPAGDAYRPAKSQASVLSDRNVAKTRNDADTPSIRVASAPNSTARPYGQSDASSSDGMKRNEQPVPSLGDTAMSTGRTMPSSWVLVLKVPSTAILVTTVRTTPPQPTSVP